MPAYIISEVNLLDKDAAKHYMKYAEASIAQYNGRYLVRGADLEVLEGVPTEQKLVIVEFPSLAQAREWYKSYEYTLALQFREKALNRRLVLVDGIAPFSL